MEDLDSNGDGRGDTIRTCDLMLPKHKAFYIFRFGSTVDAGAIYDSDSISLACYDRCYDSGAVVACRGNGAPERTLLPG